ncbi:Guanine-nucleotide dissociation stimulator CDC25 [Penicillium cf. griseofulvum]|uniref:Guanine-nucleotide dissociation stimulator CDC25 n=1 Tax=Penicillium cf. griseofulvum TaxID=2972120 RepID=A0A9W9MSN9_9EURO|nr:Guanine-nucleotide dissociation stimulator CDC25 [Penicillium cf. griseofulvum]KAJ5448206.1 Guanine-nucleotide dissociation stimulator CDC25 [Penicillium cf. griseofulvum]
MISQSRRERAHSDKAQAMATAPQRPSLGGRTSSAPGGLYKLDLVRNPGSGTKSEHTLVEEDEGSPIVGEPIKPTGFHQEKESSKGGFPEVTIAVVGEENAGKTSFVKCALDMKNPPSSTMNKKKMSLNGSVYIVHLMEVDLTQIQLDQDKKIIWPRAGRDQTPPVIDAVLVLHDATKPDRLSLTTDLIYSLAASDFPFLQVACKCDVNPEPLEDTEVDAIHDRYEIYRTSFSSPRSQRMCIALVLGAVISTREDLSNIPVSPGSPKTIQNWHTRANSENPSAVFTGQTASDRCVDGDGENRLATDGDHLQHTVNSHRYARSNSQPVRPQTPPSGARLNTRRTSVQEDSPNHDSRQQRLHTAWRHSGGSDAFSSFLTMDDDIDDGQSRPPSPGAVVRPKPSSESNSSAETGLSFDELVDRLISLPLSKQDQKFRSTFLCLYRKFAAPASLLSALISRFERNEMGNDDQLARMADQLRLLDVMAQWASDYPGDFAHPNLRKRIIEFVAILEKSHFYMFAAKEIGSQLDSNAEDDDIGWAYGGDSDSDEPQLVETFFDNSGRSSPSAVHAGADSGTTTYDTEEEQDPIYSMSALDLSTGPHDSTSRLSGTLSVSSNTDKSNSITSQSFTLLSLEAAQKEALRLELTNKISLGKLQWRVFMDTPDEEFARELTRIDWIMYNSFRPRDLVRHVSLSGIDKDKVKSLTNVNRMIKQFNHLAFFVASLILLRDKPKHRAQALEKFMSIAVKLRRQNNYNSLGAVIAAINGTPVHRLTQTRDLIPIPAQKEFMRLVILMSTQRSHFAYRLAWENSFSERIPFLPLHRRDLVSAEEGNKTFVGENKSRINWKKFEVMGEVVLGIQRSQNTPHPQAQKFDDVERLILDSKLSGDEEDLYARSLHVEPSTGAEGRRKFGWLRS